MDFTNTGTNTVTASVASRFGGGMGDKGVAVRPDGTAAVIQRESDALMLLCQYADSGSTESYFGDIRLKSGKSTTFCNRAM